MHNDEPTLTDALDRGKLIEEVGKAVATCTPPQVFGVHGDWGIGKTSFLQQVQWHLTGTCPQLSEAAAMEPSDTPFQKGKYRKAIRTIWFDAWRYQHEEVPVIALLQEMRAQLSHHRRSRMAGVAIRGALLSIEEVTKKIGFQYSKFQQANHDWKTENLDAPLPSHTMGLHLREAIAQLIPRKQSAQAPSPRLAIFIDDIDRCEPKAAFRLLEGLKIYLTLENCVFVLGMNQKVIEKAISNQIPDEDSPKERAAAYMDKLCQNVWRLPAVRRPDLFLEEMLVNTVEDETTRNHIIEGIKDLRCLPPNPRRLKGLANLIGRVSERLPDQRTTDKDSALLQTQLLMVVAYTYQFHHDLYVRWEADHKLYDRIYHWCQGKRSIPSESEDDNSGVKSPTLDIFTSMVLPLRDTGTDQDVPTPQSGMEWTYPDPGDTRVFWIQPLVQRLGDEVTSDQFRPYLYGPDQASS